MKTLLRTIAVLAATMSIVSCGGGLTGESIGSGDSSEGPDLPAYSRVPEGTCETDFANSVDTGVGEVVAPEIYFESLANRLRAVLSNETFSFRSSDGKVARIEQLDQLVQATSIQLDSADVAYLEELYQPVDNLLSIGYS